MKDLLAREIEELSKIKKIETANLVAQAIKIGVTKLWQEMILARYLYKKITRREAIKLAGIDNVRLAEKQKKIVLEDVRWGLEHA
ncbi:hypothetical protein A2625_07795 [candidate division WOR-1 bacterium RIFCSPHIGHO2_01_FULL_53_15]|uniref:Uncharacterized protein n=1 Tax=candidate division WOR-1 bacterium RIFCSPHIGHO2_01_FULL_53_15 TaxID=1802564 RepID=A0A1F4Q0J7_UNCSA|nr:MAG: hypothetical protein A2625_07795 [candidate division WOR-1 bacterium RIFCSPHIGHO2_01_FULL_53_15]OGC12612.1 MAG: hypothetical protein A3D23_02575 [candidate division WOR-1 bacterium RIFCSPHIGHO2_02_FULL_53_26]